MAGSNQQSSESAMQAMEWMRNMADQLLKDDVGELFHNGSPCF